MVLMAQDFFFSLPLIDGKETGALRTIQIFCRHALHRSQANALRSAASEECEQGTVDWVPEFRWNAPRTDALTRAHPQHPAKRLHRNRGRYGNRNIPSHNATEVLSACIHLLDHLKQRSKIF